MVKKLIKKHKMEEKLISLEVAKLAKEKGFDLEVSNYFKIGMLSKGVIEEDCAICEINGKFPDRTIFARTTQSLLQKWLREKHNIHVMLDVSNLGVRWFFILSNVKEMIVLDSVISNYHDTYEDALEQGLLESLKLI